MEGSIRANKTGGAMITFKGLGPDIERYFTQLELIALHSAISEALEWHKDKQSKEFKW